MPLIIHNSMFSRLWAIRSFLYKFNGIGEKVSLNYSMQDLHIGQLSSTWMEFFFTWNSPFLHLEFPLFSPGIFLYFTWNFPFFHLEFSFISPGIFLFFTWNFPFFHLEFSLFHLEILVFFSNVIASIFHFITLELPLTGGYGCFFFLEKPSFLKSNFHVLEHENSYLPFIV